MAPSKLGRCLVVGLFLIISLSSPISAQETGEQGQEIKEPKTFTVTSPSLGTKYLAAEIIRANRVIVKGVDLLKLIEGIMNKLEGTDYLTRDDLKHVVEDATVNIVREEE